ncbi:family 16 glycoside hydrolase [Pelagicoccus mobilis]|uniref:DUF1080 domain-containing protein n=1 Tax=Pelagicoccus mobilis TaxID=415221 RepID=A0A934S673_9BACT|nr:family 16 glycoside hydrolase [Pelagicoccus mobilis]MBK1879678.1 DUF1080 domain-containing protein [Pelagicoccus mobilis]
MRKLLLSLTVLAHGLLPFALSETADDNIKVMLLTGRSNKYHNWKGNSAAIHRHLENAGIFEVDTVVTTPTGESLEGFSPKWSDYQAIVMDYEGEEWPEATKESFVKYMKNGGGLVIVHGSDNSFPHWPEFNEMIGLGGWGGAGLHAPPLYPDDPSKRGSRNHEWGPRVHWKGCQAVHLHDKGGAFHPPSHDFIMTVRTPDHPITKGLPEMWLHANDEVYSRLRGPAKNMTILATGFANPAKRNASPYNEPLLFTIDYGKGRVFHTTLGHVGAKQDDTVPAVNNVDFILTLQRGTEWAATSEVTIPVPDDFPHAYQTSIRPHPKSGWSDLLDPELSKWETFMGIPHSTVKDLPAGTFQSEDVTKGTPMGLNNDPKRVFSTYHKDGETILHITGEIYGGLTTLESYADYHLQAQVRWGEKKWEPRLTVKRDSGILYHCHGEHGAFWNVWKSCLEFQVQESDMGDFITLAGPKAKAPQKKDGKRTVYALGKKYEEWSGYLHAEVEPDYPNGEWNTLDIYVVGDQAIHVVNGKLVMSLKDAVDKNGKKLTSGQIQIQSEAAEVEYKNVRIRPIKTLPPVLVHKAQL